MGKSHCKTPGAKTSRKTVNTQKRGPGVWETAIKYPGPPQKTVNSTQIPGVFGQKDSKYPKNERGQPPVNDPLSRNQSRAPRRIKAVSECVLDVVDF
jgi:hypothetical protein